MPAKLPDSVVSKMCALRKKGLTIVEISEQLGVDNSTVSRNLRRYLSQGAPPGETPEPIGPLYQEAKGGPPVGQPGEVINKIDIDGSVDVVSLDRPARPEEIRKMCNLDHVRWLEDVYRANMWQGFYKLKTKEGHKKVQLYQSRCTFRRIMTETLEHAICDFARKYIKPLLKKALPKRQTPRFKPGTGQMLCWGLWDAHIGMYAWNPETRNDFDVDIACNRICNTVDDLIPELRHYPIERIVMPVGNDYLHFDNAKHTTTFGEHFLDTDTRYARVYLWGLKCLSYMIERALEICDDVRILYVPGNHDVTSSYTLVVALSQRYLNDKRVTVSLDPNPRKYVMFGGTLLGFDHGRNKPSQLKDVFSTEAKDHWSSSTYREIQIGDKHQRWEMQHEGVIPTNGVLIRRNPCLCNVDTWHYKQGLVGEPVKSIEAWRYSRIGYVGSHVAWARDEEHKARKNIKL